MPTKLDDVLLDHLDDLKTHEGYRVLLQHIEVERERVINEVAGQRLDPSETDYKRGFLAGLNFARQARQQIYDQRRAEIDQPTKGPGHASRR